MPSYPLTNFKIQKYQIKFKINGVCSRKNLSKIMDVAYVIRVEVYKLTAAHWIALYTNGDNATFFDSFGVEHIPKEI